jgi:hypothetical protein
MSIWIQILEQPREKTTSQSTSLKFVKGTNRFDAVEMNSKSARCSASAPSPVVLADEVLQSVPVHVALCSGPSFVEIQ